MMPFRLALLVLGFVTLVVAAAMPGSLPHDTASTLSYRQMGAIRGAATCEGCELEAKTDCQLPDTPCIQCWDSTAKKTVEGVSCPDTMRDYSAKARNECKANPAKNNKYCFDVFPVVCWTDYDCVDSGVITGRRCNMQAINVCGVVDPAYYCRDCRLANPLSTERKNQDCLDCPH